MKKVDEKPEVKIDFSKIGEDISQYIRKKAIRTRTKIVYGENGQIIEEDPKTGKKKVLRPSTRK